MGDYTNSKSGIGGMYPEGAIEQDWQRTEPLINPEKLRKLHLWGIPLVSRIKNPNTGKYDEMTPEDIKEQIIEAVGLAETESGIEIFPTQRKEKGAFDKAEYDSFGYFKLRHRPVSSIESLNVVPSNEVSIFNVPNEWIDVGFLHRGQFNIIPLMIAMKSGTVVPAASGPGGAAFLSIFGYKHWVASFWEITYTTGFPNGSIPKPVNQLIGVIAAMEILGLLATTYSRATSTSIGLDGASQSISTPGPELFNTRIEALAAKRKWLIGKIRAHFGMKFVMNNV